MTTFQQPKVGDHTLFRVTLVTLDGSVLPLQTSATRELHFLARRTGETFQRTATFVTDGSDGRIQWQDDGTMQTLARVGPWSIEAFVELGDGSKFKTVTPMEFTLLAGIVNA